MPPRSTRCDSSGAQATRVSAPAGTETLLALWRNRQRKSSQVKRITLEHAADLQRRIAAMQAMQAMQRTLQ